MRRATKRARQHDPASTGVVSKYGHQCTGQPCTIGDNAHIHHCKAMSGFAYTHSNKMNWQRRAKEPDAEPRSPSSRCRELGFPQLTHARARSSSLVFLLHALKHMQGPIFSGMVQLTSSALMAVGHGPPIAIPSARHGVRAASRGPPQQRVVIRDKSMVERPGQTTARHWTMVELCSKTPARLVRCKCACRTWPCDFSSQIGYTASRHE